MGENIKVDLKKTSVRECGMDSSISEYFPVEGSWEYGNESFGYIKEEIS
jgi:hypothetical protein